MRLQTFDAYTIEDAMRKVREAFGEEALIVSTEPIRRGTAFRVTASVPDAAGETKFGPAAERNFNGPPVHDPQPILKQAMIENGVTDELAAHLLMAARNVAVPISPALALAAGLEACFRFQPLVDHADDEIGMGATKRAIMLVGPPGSGKTVSAAKLAVQSARGGISVRLATIDTIKTGGADQLQLLTKALKLDLRVADNPETLAELISGNLRGMIVVDSSGINPFDAMEREHLETFIEAADIEPVLVLPAGLDQVDAIETARAFATLGCRRIIVTRLDMSRRIGSTLHAVATANYAFSDVSVSPEIIGSNDAGLSPLNPVALARFMLPVDVLHGSPEGRDTPPWAISAGEK